MSRCIQVPMVPPPSPSPVMGASVCVAFREENETSVNVPSARTAAIFISVSYGVTPSPLIRTIPALGLLKRHPCRWRILLAPRGRYSGHAMDRRCDRRLSGGADAHHRLN